MHSLVAVCEKYTRCEPLSYQDKGHILDHVEANRYFVVSKRDSPIQYNKQAGENAPYRLSERQRVKRTVIQDFYAIYLMIWYQNDLWSPT